MKFPPLTAFPSRSLRAFTLIEIAVASAVLALILILLFSITDITSRTWRGTTEKMQAFDAARTSFDQITTTLSQAVLNTYWDYDNLAAPTKYERRSELQFLSLPMEDFGFSTADYPTHGVFFQAPTGAVTNKASHGNLPLVLNAFGYFVTYGDDTFDRPTFLAGLTGVIKPRYRYRLMQWKVPAEQVTLYEKTSGVTGRDFLGSSTLAWIDLNNPHARALAENVVALVIYPKNTESVNSNSTSLTTDFFYNSRDRGDARRFHQLPPEVEVIMVAIDESSATRIFQNSQTSPDLTRGLFTTATADQIETDLDSLTEKLTNQGIRFIVLRTTVKIRGARWSQS
jgi:uncharacterized protein (TIGR02599 family)